MIATLYNVALLQDCDELVNKKWVCLKDLKNYWLKSKKSYQELHEAKNSWYLTVTLSQKVRWCVRYYYRLTIKGKKALWLPLTIRETLFFM